METFTPAEAVDLAAEEVEARYNYSQVRFSPDRAASQAARETWEALHAKVLACIDQFDGTPTLDKMRAAARKIDVRTRTELDTRDKQAYEAEQLRISREIALEELIRERLGGRP